MWDLPGPGLEPVPPALAGRFLTTAPPGKTLCFNLVSNFSSWSISQNLFKELIVTANAMDHRRVLVTLLCILHELFKNGIIKITGQSCYIHLADEEIEPQDG